MTGKHLTLASLAVLTGLLSCCRGDRGTWEPLFNGTDLSEFQQLGGKAPFTAENGMITGTSVANTENSFLCTKKSYGDFILEFKVLVDTALNSGVQIRSHAYLNGRVHGYQVEIDPAPRAWSGGLYDEARRGWLFDLSENPAGRAAFRNNEWNQYRVEAVGNSVRTWVNGVMCANLVDEADSSGFIAFQVHSLDLRNKPWSEGVEVKWKDIRIMTGDLEPYRFHGEDPVPVKVAQLTNRLGDKEKEEGWQLLFDGRGTEGWRGVCRDAFPDSAWMIVGGALESQTEGNALQSGDILTLEQYPDFDLRIDFMLTPGTGSAIGYFVTEEDGNGCKALGPEYQLADDAGAIASLSGLIPATGTKFIREAGQWNMAGIVSKGQVVEHWLNGQKVLEYNRESADLNNLRNFGKAGSGHILLRNQGSGVSFRNIKIRNL